MSHFSPKCNNYKFHSQSYFNFERDIKQKQQKAPPCAWAEQWRREKLFYWHLNELCVCWGWKTRKLSRAFPCSTRQTKTHFPVEIFHINYGKLTSKPPPRPCCSEDDNFMLRRNYKSKISLVAQIQLGLRSPIGHRLKLICEAMACQRFRLFNKLNWYIFLLFLRWYP